MSDEFEKLAHQVHDAIDSKKPASECEEISDRLLLALVIDPHSDELKALNYRWQTYLSKEYVREHRIDEFLDSLVRHVLLKKPENPLEEMYLLLGSGEGNAGASQQ